MWPLKIPMRSKTARTCGVSADLGRIAGGGWFCGLRGAPGPSLPPVVCTHTRTST